MTSISPEQWAEYNFKFCVQLHGSYPSGADALREFLNTDQELVNNSFGWEDLDLDLDTQVKHEYVSYLLDKFCNQASEKVKASVFLEECNKVGSVSLRDLVHILSRKLVSLQDSKVSEESGKVEQITSYLLSSSISKGIELPTIINSDNYEIRDPVSFCKKHIDMLLELFPKMNDSSEVSPKIEENKGTKDEEDIKDLKTAIKDLQLAYNFLQSKYENDRKSYLSRIEILNKTNKDLSEELLRYHSKLKEAEGGNLTSTPPTSMEFVSFSPSCLESPSKNASQSFNMMKQEFKRILTDTQSKYEKELQQERELRIKLQERVRELESSK